MADKRSFPAKLLRKLLRRLNPFRALGRARLSLVNRRRLRHKDLDVIMLTLAGTIPATPEPRGFVQRRLFGPAPLSLWQLETIFDQIAHDPRPKTIVLTLRGLAMPLADLQTLRGMMLRLKARGKRIVCYAQGYDNTAYYLASIADEILLQPTADFAVTGLQSEAFFLKDLLAQAGVSVDVIAISPYKSAFEQVAASAMSDESRAQVNWLLDSRYDQLVRGMAEGRKKSPDDIRAMIDSAPCHDTQALESGFVDGLCYEDELPTRLGVKRLVRWDEARRKLIRQPRKQAGPKRVAVLTVAGLMVPGESGGAPGDIPLPIPVPLLGEDRAGDATVVRQVRALLKDESIGAVVLMIDSGGGAVTAAAHMGAALDTLATHVPLVAYMNGVAASGGYWIATSAAHIIAQPGTITGSIGVITAKPNTQTLFDKLHVTTAQFKRGANADLYSTNVPFSEAQRALVRDGVLYAYDLFVKRTAQKRGLSEAAVDAVAGGRVWTGEQALSHGLIDGLGDLRDALAKARALAKLPDDAPVVFWTDDDAPAPSVIERAGQTARAWAAGLLPAAWLGHLLTNARAVASGQAQALLPFWLRDGL
ncbi:MAG: signal peptide peptidase SppA [Pleurocapsa minor GSE-CHR-MK-17-07R]|nr:signal peptide peptidase SppA [Pleurocapsa minor GSE-CHR-MK 17-07R]